jgi:single-strand DNA-binding protein
MLNNFVIVGRLVEIKDKDGYSIMTLACNRPFKNEEGIYETDFIDLKLFGKVGETTKEYCNKGDVIGAKGRIQTKEIESQKVTELVADKITFLTKKGE